jgi:pimeloyl-ACP methyl ester carboxylesterase
MNTIANINIHFPAGSMILRWLLRVIIILLAVILMFLLVGFISDTIASRSDLQRYPPPGKLIDMGGFKLHLYCTGERVEGLPTVILEAGSGAASPDWGLVQPEIAKITRVCSYDRAGYAWSSPGPLPRTSQRFAEELYSLLSKAGEEAPYVLVGHSFGGHTVRLFAHEHPQETVGVILVDARPEELTSLGFGMSDAQMSFWAFMARCGFFRLVGKTLLPPATLEKIPDYPWPILFRPQFFETSRDEDAVESDKQVQATGNLGGLPLIVIAHGNASMFAYLPADEAVRVEKAWQDAQRKLAGMSSNSQLIVAEESGHAIPIERPDVVIDAIQQILSSK